MEGPVSDRGRDRSAQCGYYSIEAALAVFPFILACLAVIMLVAAVRTESTVRSALDQTAREISQYCYLAGKAGELTGVTSKSGGSTQEIRQAEELLDSFSEFASMIGELSGSGGIEGMLSGVTGELSSLSDESGYSSVVSAASRLGKNLSAFADDPRSALFTLAGVLINRGASEAVSRAAAIPLCRMLFPKYIVESGKAADADEELRRIGVDGGLDGIDFGLSSVLADGKTVKVVAFYRIKLLGFGFLPGEIKVCQTASTAAWLPEIPDTDGGGDDGSVWKLDNFARGKYFVAEIKGENPSDAIKGGKGIDCYDLATSAFTSVISVNPFSATYSEFIPPEEGVCANAENYRINESAVAKAISKAASKLKKSISALKKGDLLEREIGGKIGPDLSGYSACIIVIFPEEAETYSEIIKSAAEKAAKRQGVSVTVKYRYKALPGSAEDQD